MKKFIFLFALLFVSLFGSANTNEMNSLVSATSTEAIKDFSSSQEIVATSSEVTAIVVDEFCITTEIRLKVGSSVNMLGQVVDHYEVYVSVTCYFPTPPCSLC